jgi:hypothetical protein
MKNENIHDYIAGWKTADDWRAMKQQFVNNGDAALWKKAYDEFFVARLNARYLEPIRVLQENGTFSGEGFSIVAIQCSLVEFLETTVRGVSYRYTRDPKTLGPHEYSSSSTVFTEFLRSREPFRHHFDEATAVAFYENIRCGLLHEARTKGGWRIWAESTDGSIVDPNKKIVYRNDFQTAFQTFITSYGIDLPQSADLQAAFIRKFDALCLP